MGSASSKFRKHLQSGDEVQALSLYRSNNELRRVLDPNCSYGDSHQHQTPLHLAAKHGMLSLLKIFLFSKGGNPNKTNSRKETSLHCVCMETNAQSVHVCSRRYECLICLLKWRGATLSEGQVEKIDLAAQDENLNTALHYAAASGLSQCVETLIQHRAPMFLENDEGLTPCDMAERNNHSRIALYLESKMVFSTEDDSVGDDDIPMPPMEEYSGLRPQDLQEAKDQLLVETADMLSVPLFTAEALLRNHEWSRETLLEAWMSDPIACCEICGVTPPSSLFSEKPEVQENLASPLPSPLHSHPMPLDAECDICTNTFLIADEPVHMTCTHKFCKDCWERYLNVKIQEGDAHHITCPAYDCTMLVPVDIIEGIVSRDMARRYLQFDIKAFVDSNPDMKWCPFPGCSRAVKLPDLIESRMNRASFGGVGGQRGKIPADTSRGVDCGAGHYFCWECLAESHEPCSCENWSKWAQKIAEIKPESLGDTEQESELAANCLWLVTNSKPCPNCKSPIQKNEGCNHMKCSKCKYDFCWVCLEMWSRHNSSTGGYFKCNRYEVVKKVEEHSATLLTEAEEKNKNLQELSRFVHYYTRFKNHENSFKFEEPLLRTAKDKMMKLAEAVTDKETTAQAETQFVEDAVQQLLKARNVLKCSYVYGYYLDGPGYKKIVFELMQTELEECTEILSQAVNRLYLRTPRRRIIEQAHIVQRKRLEFIMAIAKGLVPPETPPATRKAGKRRRKLSGDAEDEELHKAIMASIQEVNPANPWIKDASGKHTNVVALLEWPSDEDSDDSDAEADARYRGLAKCQRSGCNKLQVRNPRTKELHNYCSMWCMLLDSEDIQPEEGGGVSEIQMDEHMELLRALEMSRLQHLRDTGLLHVPETQDDQDQSSQDSESKSPQTEKSHKSKHRPRSNSAGHELRAASRAAMAGGLNSMEELGRELQKFQALASGTTDVRKLLPSVEDRKQRSKWGQHHRKLSQSSRFEENKSTVVARVPNKSVEDLYELDQTGSAKSTKLSSDMTGQTVSLSPSPEPAANLSSEEQQVAGEASSSPSAAANLASKGRGVLGSMFGAIKDLSVSNIHATEDDKTKDFLSKDLTAIFAGWDLEESFNAENKYQGRSSPSQTRVDKEVKKQTNLEDSNKSRRSTSGKSTGETSRTKGGRVKGSGLKKSHGSPRSRSKREGSSSKLDSAIAYPGFRNEEEVDEGLRQALVSTDQYSCDYVDKDSVKSEKQLDAETGKGKSGEATLLEMAENLLQMTADVHSRMKEVEKGIRSLSMASVKSAIGERLGIDCKEDGSKNHDSSTASLSDRDGEMDASSLSASPSTARSIRSFKDAGKMDEKVIFHLPKTAWVVGDRDSESSVCMAKSTDEQTRPISREDKHKSTDRPTSSDRHKSKKSSKSKKSKMAAQRVALLCDASGAVHERYISADRPPQSDFSCSDGFSNVPESLPHGNAPEGLASVDVPKISLDVNVSESLSRVSSEAAKEFVSSDFGGRRKAHDSFLDNDSFVSNTDDTLPSQIGDVAISQSEPYCDDVLLSAAQQTQDIKNYDNNVAKQFVDPKLSDMRSDVQVASGAEQDYPASVTDESDLQYSLTRNFSTEELQPYVASLQSSREQNIGIDSFSGTGDRNAPQNLESYSDSSVTSALFSRQATGQQVLEDDSLETDMSCEAKDSVYI